MNREVSKFFSGAFAGLAWTHAAYAIAVSNDILDEPTFLGRKWGIGYMWTEAITYVAISASLAYIGWRPEPVKPQAVGASDVQGKQGLTEGQEPQLLSR